MRPGLALSRGVYYCRGVSTIETAKAAQDRLTAANQNFIHAAAERDAAVKGARQAGVSANELATTLGLSKQQVHKIIKGA